MPKVEPGSFGIKPRIDGKPGWKEITPTTQRYVEADKSDVRLRRVRLFDPDGHLEHTYLVDEMGVRFEDIPDLKDDPPFLDSLKSSSIESK